MHPDNMSRATKLLNRWIILFIIGYSFVAEDSPRKNGFVKA